MCVYMTERERERDSVCVCVFVCGGEEVLLASGGKGTYNIEGICAAVRRKESALCSRSYTELWVCWFIEEACV